MNNYYFSILALLSTVSLVAMEQPEKMSFPSLLSESVSQPAPAVATVEKIEVTPEQKTALFAAVRTNNATQIRDLLNKSANPQELANSNDPRTGISALREAATGGYSDVIEELIRAGAGPDTADSYNMTPLMLAALQGHVDTVFKLIKLGANVNAKDAGGQTVLQWVQFGAATPEVKAKITQMLKDAGAR